jgi:predicted metal-dependent peptidase
VGCTEFQGADQVNQDLQHYLKEIDRTKLRLMKMPETTFYSSFISMLNVRISYEVPTAATDGLKVIFNPDFIDEISRDELLGLLLHEVEHVVNGHCDFKTYEGYCRDVLNIAQDHYINLRLQAKGFKLPPTPKLGGPPNTNGFADPKFKGMSSMEIYHELIKDGKPQPEPDLLDVLEAPEGMSPEEHAERVSNNVIKAVIMAEQANDAGSIPGDLRRDLQDILSPKLPWQTILQQYLTEYAAEDYSMRRPNRRFMPAWYLPVLEGEGLGNLFMYCDVSGSMSVEDVSEIWSEYVYIVDTMNPKSVRIMTGDTRVILDKTYDQGDFIPEFEYSGGGGTYFEPIMQALREEEPVFALLFTDGYFSMPDMSDINTDIFWIIKGNPGFHAPKGEIIHFE